MGKKETLRGRKDGKDILRILTYSVLIMENGTV